MPENATDLERRIEQLEQRVDELERRLDTESDASNDLDRYDGTVLTKIEEHYDRSPTVKEVVKLYEDAGVLNRQKIKRRHKRLKRTGRIETAVKK